MSVIAAISQRVPTRSGGPQKPLPSHRPPGAARTKLGTIWARAGHDVVFSYARDAGKLQRLAGDAGNRARAGTPHEAAQHADAVLLAVNWAQLDDLLAQAGDLAGKVVVTCALPMGVNDEGLLFAKSWSGAEELAKRLPHSHVVAAFGTVPSECFFGVYEARHSKRPSLIYYGAEPRGHEQHRRRLAVRVGPHRDEVGELAALRQQQRERALHAERLAGPERCGIRKQRVRQLDHRVLDASSEGAVLEDRDDARLGIPWREARAQVAARLDGGRLGAPVLGEDRAAPEQKVKALSPDRPRSGSSPDVTICYLAVLMSKRKFTKHTVATPDVDPATLAQLRTFERLRKRASRALLKRRRQKSGQ